MNILYIKQHNQTLLKYLGKTTQDPYKYKGSGKYWKDHLKVHGNDVDTYIIGTYETKEALIEAGIYYSQVWNVVESDEWANLQPEEGMGAASGENNPMKRSEIVAKFMGEKNAMFGRNRPDISEWNIKTKAKTYPFISPKGELVEIHNLYKFCQENNLDQGNMWNVAKGKLKQYKGWKMKKE